MKAITQHVHGELIAENGRAALLLLDPEPPLETAKSKYLRYAFTLQGVETPVFPSLMLDDWGSEIRGLELYQWVNEFGHQFPRAELFGFDLQGNEVQYFLREIELYARLRCYVYLTKDTSLDRGIPLAAILLPDEQFMIPRKVKRPSTIKGPLWSARVTWWLVNPEIKDLGSVFRLT